MTQKETVDEAGTYIGTQKADVKVRIELGRGWMWAQELASLGPGSMVQLQTLSDQLVDVYAGGRLVARGELVCMDGNFALCVREVEERQTTGSRP